MKFSSLISPRFAVVLLAPLVFASCVTPPPSRQADAPANPDLNTGRFWWGTSTSTFQNEDRGMRPGEPGYFRTDWDVFADEGKVPARGDEATWSWSRFDKDVDALKELGVTHYRFGVEWARVEPKPGEYNEAALRQYARMARQLRANGIEPIITLWHFTFPDWLYDAKRKNRSNFLHPDVEERWEAFVTKTMEHLGRDVRIYIPQNEPNGALFIGYFGGHWPPGLLVTPGALKKAARVSENMFIRASEIIHEKRPDALVGGIYSIPHWRRNRLWDPTGFVYNMMQRQNFDHLDATAHAQDFIGVNYYYSQEASAARFIRRPHGELTSNYTQNGWEIQPEGLYNVLKEVWGRYGKPIVITENGIGTQSEQKKIRYFRDHVNQVFRAMNDGVDVRGYLPWTLVDNYEWAEGFGANFGFTHMTPDGRKLTIEPSGLWFRNFIRARPEPRKESTQFEVTRGTSARGG